MAPAETKKIGPVKVKKKVWYKVLAPKVFGQRELGEMYLASAESALGRILKINLKDITNNVRDQNARVVFRISHWNGNNLDSEVVGYEIIPSSVRRMIRKNLNRVYDCSLFKTSNGEEVIIKTLLTTLHKTKHSLRTKLQKELRALLGEEISKIDSTLVVGNLAANKIQEEIKRKLHKIYPLREIAVLKLIRKKVVAEEASAKEKLAEETGREGKGAVEETIPPLEKERGAAAESL